MGEEERWVEMKQSWPLFFGGSGERIHGHWKYDDALVFIHLSFSIISCPKGKREPAAPGQVC